MGQFATAQRKDQLRQERVRRNWRQQDLAEQLGTTVVTVKRWERGSQQPSAYFRLKLCALFDKSAEELGLVPLSPQPATPPEMQGNIPVAPANSVLEVARHEQAELQSLQALHMWEQVLGPSHLNQIYLLNGLARISFHQGKYGQATILFQRALSICIQIVGPQAPETAETLHGLAVLREAQGQSQAATCLYQRALKIWEQILGSDHQHTREVRTQYQRLLQLVGVETKTNQMKMATSEAGNDAPREAGLSTS
ncbi:MAG: tetratricopeptide repeat protein [Ktedonobacteraceae bacterium]